MKPETFFAYLGRPYINAVAVCAWCPDAKLATEAAESEGCTVTHGICPECKARELVVIAAMNRRCASFVTVGGVAPMKPSGRAPRDYPVDARPQNRLAAR